MFDDHRYQCFEPPIHPYDTRSDWNDLAQRRYEVGYHFMNAMLEHQSRYLMVILTLNYSEECRHRMTLDDLRRDRDHLFRNMRNNDLLKGINGYIWAIEEGETSGGLHLHLILFYDRDFKGDIAIGNAIGKYWEDIIAPGRGAFWNSSWDKADNARRWGDATGQLNRHDWSKRLSLCLVIGYFAKDAQRVSSRNNPHIRMFGTSGSPN